MKSIGAEQLLSAAPGLPRTLAAGWWDWLWYHNNTKTSTFAAPTDAVFFFIFWVSAFFFVVLMGLMVWFAWKYRRVAGRAPELSPAHNTPLELVWSIVPTILLAVMFFWGLIEYLPMKIPPADAEVVNVTARQWAWEWVYDNGATTREVEMIANVQSPVFALPLNKPVKFVMSSKDVIHSLYFPAFRAKRDVFPNFYTTQWVQATVATHQWSEELKKFQPIAPGANDGFYIACAEYCGNQHSQMWGRIMVLSDPDYRRWKDMQASTDDVPLVKLGALLHKVGKGCNSCHTLDGSKGTGPSWKGIWGKTEQFKDGGSATVDESYIRESILEPSKHIVAGFSNQMTSFQGQITERQIMAIVTFIRSLSDNPEDVKEAEEASVKELEKQAADKAAAAAAAPAPAAK